MITEEQRKLRRLSIGGSDAAAILGLSKWKSPFRVWMEKTGAVEVPEINSWPIRWGTKTEHAVRELFEEESGKKVRQRYQTLVHPEYEFITANLDGVIVGERAVFEAKTATVYKAKAWQGDEIPVQYLIQGLHYLAVTGYDRVYFACMIGNSDFVWKVVERDEELIKQIIDAEVKFWNEHVIANEPPELDGSEDASRILSEQYPDAEDGSEIELDKTADELIKTISEAKTLEKEWADVRKTAENKLKEMLGKYEHGQASDATVHWSNYSRQSLDTKRLKLEMPDVYDQYVKTTKYRQLKIKED
ncbi:MAG: YqaJ viral recombinase family protein [Bacilli bacterium]